MIDDFDFRDRGYQFVRKIDRGDTVPSPLYRTSLQRRVKNARSPPEDKPALFYAKTFNDQYAVMKGESMAREIVAYNLWLLPPHPRICRLYEDLPQRPRDDENTIMLEWCNAGSIETLLQRAEDLREHIPEDFCWHLFLQMAEAIVHIHGLAVTHGEPSAANFFLEYPRNKVAGFPDTKLADFEYANNFEEGFMELNKSFSPEKRSWEGSCAVDIKRIGCVMMNILFHNGTCNGGPRPSERLMYWATRCVPAIGCSGVPVYSYIRDPILPQLTNEELQTQFLPEAMRTLTEMGNQEAPAWMAKHFRHLIDAADRDRSPLTLNSSDEVEDVAMEQPALPKSKETMAPNNAPEDIRQVPLPQHECMRLWDDIRYIEDLGKAIVHDWGYVRRRLRSTRQHQDWALVDLYQEVQKKLHVELSTVESYHQGDNTRAITIDRLQDLQAFRIETNRRLSLILNRLQTELSHELGLVNKRSKWGFFW